MANHCHSTGRSRTARRQGDGDLHPGRLPRGRRRCHGRAAGAGRICRKDGRRENTTSHFLWFSYADPDVLRTIFFSGNIGNFNFAQYSDPDVDQMLLDAAASTDAEERQALYSQIQLKLLDDAVTIPLADSITYNAKRQTSRAIFSTSWRRTSG